MSGEHHQSVSGDYFSFENFGDGDGTILKDGGHQVLEKGPIGSRVLQQQWVTLTASMWPEPTASTRGWRVSAERLPLLAAVFCGAAVVVCLLCALVLYRCCVMPRKDKSLCAPKVDAKPTASQSTQVPISQAAIYAERKGNNWGYSNRLITPVQHGGGPWYIPRIVLGNNAQCDCPVVPRSCSNPGAPGGSQVHTQRKQQVPRPVSQPVQMSNGGEILPGNLPYTPELCEFSVNQYASSSILDEVDGKDSQSGASLKTRSLPAWVRSKQRPLSTEDDLNDLYAKVNFSKKRKNRMRNDEAAIIALSKSRSQYLNKDTDSLVDNEAVIVYDERTAL